MKKPLHILVHATVAQQVGVTGLADGLVISRAGLEFSAGKLLVLPQPLRLGGQDCSRAPGGAQGGRAPWSQL